MEKELLQGIAEALAEGRSVVAATVVARRGSAPREVGAAMAVFADGAALGTVGGGALEARIVAAAATVLAQGRPRLERFSLTDAEAARDGMICGGTVEVLLEGLDGGDEGTRRLFASLLSLAAQGRRAWLVRSVRRRGDGGVETGLGLLTEDRLEAGTLDGAALDEGRLRQEARWGGATTHTAAGVLYLLQPVTAPGRVIVCGGGHVGLYLARLCAVVGLQAVVVDDRPAFAAPERFPAARVVLAREGFFDCLSGLAVGREDKICILTRGHEHDETVLAQALGTPAGYIGMIGSRRKREAVFRNLRAAGFTAGDLGRVRCPIGLDIGARTPAEIALSIVAEIVAHDAGGRPGP
ncbi:MAG TPA: XdhC family protein [Syntrophales bacterium]|nr:XdhC family protein [Syntrophales bacterium]HOM06354.1 XdhC family protein [Syntrophales bacterium]HON99195.1 XdhC family protein [Syntrophales bacterium]HPC00303.1 XdhC family protein [Syntrophales bacterium]HPQ05966.1 XdhC family protein [Syntrophales bacterium]